MTYAATRNLKAKRIFIDAPLSERCEANITLRDGSQAQCGRYKKVGCLCKQHAKKAGVV